MINLFRDEIFLDILNQLKKIFNSRASSSFWLNLFGNGAGTNLGTAFFGQTKINFMVTMRERMKIFWLKMLLLRSGQYDGPLLFFVARVKEGGGEF